MNDLFQNSIKIILQNQTPSGAYVACPDYPTYHYCWFRDGSFIAYAMDLVGEHESAERFHNWAATVVNARSHVVQRAKTKAQRSEALTAADYLHTRYSPDGGEAVGEEWPDFQTDGFGTWLWALGEHLSLSGKPIPEAWEHAAGLAADYLSVLWQHPCYDSWEEHPDKIHLYTLAAIYGGLQAHARLADRDHKDTLQAIKTFVQKNGEKEGYFVKFIGSDVVDANLLGLATPYRLVSPDHDAMLATAAKIEQTLSCKGVGIHRYATDTFYGGGEWVLLTGWLGWYYTEIGKTDQARAILRWIESQADKNGYLPEQVANNLNDPNYFAPWAKRWGPIASPLLWSHAMYIILSQVLAR